MGELCASFLNILQFTHFPNTVSHELEHYANCRNLKTRPFSSLVRAVRREVVYP